MFDPELPPPHVLWTLTSQDETTGTVGASAYDFDADGADDIAYSDECRVTILSGRDGTPRWVASNPSLTLFEYPVVADVDADGEAELAVVGNRRYFEQIGELGCPGRLDPWMGANGGLRVYGDTLDAWGPTRATWDQHTYVADALADDGTVPAEVTRPWDEHNTVRANPRPVGDRTPLPDLRVGALRARYAETCGRGPLRVEAQIENRGMVAVAAGVTVRFGAVTSRTTAPLLPGAAEWVVSPPIRRDGVDGALTVSVDADGSVTECHEANAASLTVRCR